METKLLIIIGIVLGVGVLLILSLNMLSEIRKQECKADGGVVIGPFSCVTSHADYDSPLTKSDLEKDCNNIDGRTEAQCFKDDASQEKCTSLGGEWSNEFHNCVVDTNSEPVIPPLQIIIVGENQVRRGTTQSIDIQVVRGSSPIEGARVFIDIEDYGEDLIKEFDGYTNSEGYFVFSWEIPQSFDDVETLLAFIDVTDGISSKTELFKFQVYCLPGEKNCKVEGN